jgi:hypothetical protein
MGGGCDRIHADWSQDLIARLSPTGYSALK